MTRSTWKASPREIDQNVSKSRSMLQDDVAAGLSIDFVMYAIIITVVLGMVIALILKLLWTEDTYIADESTRLLTASTSPKEDNHTFEDNNSYGKMTSLLCSSDQEDLESSSAAEISCTSLDLYDAKICVICYDQLRNCLFTPCGHSVACINCTDRIMSEETRSCPICRTSIKQVSEFHFL